MNRINILKKKFPDLEWSIDENGAYRATKDGKFIAFKTDLPIKGFIKCQVETLVDNLRNATK